MDKKWLLRTAGWASIALGVYLIHKGMDEDNSDFTIRDDVLDAEFTILDD